ncbi:MAG: LytTR family DNA-binding domain-containing protein, partial [Bacteroidota bacterium]
SRGVSLIYPKDIIRVSADNNYVSLHFTSSSVLTVAKSIKDLELRLEPMGFFRIHKSHLINLQHLDRYSNDDGGLVVMNDQSRLPVSKRRLNAFLQCLEAFSISLR